MLRLYRTAPVAAISTEDGLGRPLGGGGRPHRAEHEPLVGVPADERLHYLLAGGCKLVPAPRGAERLLAENIWAPSLNRKRQETLRIIAECGLLNPTLVIWG